MEGSDDDYDCTSFSCMNPSLFKSEAIEKEAEREPTVRASFMSSGRIAVVICTSKVVKKRFEEKMCQAQVLPLCNAVNDRHNHHFRHHHNWHPKHTPILPPFRQRITVTTIIIAVATICIIPEVCQSLLCSAFLSCVPQSSSIMSPSFHASSSLPYLCATVFLFARSSQ